MEEGLSVNWVEYFQQPTPKDAIPSLLAIFAKKKFNVGATAKLALLNIGAAQQAASKYAAVSIVLAEEEHDPSHSLVKNYDQALNEQVAEQLAKVIIEAYPAKAKP